MLSLCLCISLINFWMPSQIFIKFYIHITTSEPMSVAYFINLSHQSVSLYVYPVVAKQRFLIKVTAAANTHANNRINAGSVEYYAVISTSKKIRCVILPRSPWLITSKFVGCSEHTVVYGPVSRQRINMQQQRSCEEQCFLWSATGH
jgi:hypothetical protein